MRLTFEHGWPLLLLLAVVPIWWARRTTIIEFHRRQLDMMAAARALAVVLLALALAEPTLYRNGSWTAVAYLLDVSRSVDPATVEEAIDWIGEADRTGAADASRFLAFGANTLTVSSAQALHDVPVADRPEHGAVDRSSTDLATALERGLASLPPHHVNRLVVLTDGNGNAGDLEATIEHLRLEGVPVDARLLTSRGGPDAWVEIAEAPAEVDAGEPFPLRVVAHSHRPTAAQLLVVIGDDVLLRERLQLNSGAQSLTLRPIAPDAGDLVLEVMLAVEGDPQPDNNVVRTSLFARERARVLYVEGVGGVSDYLRVALEAGGFDVDVRPPVRLPRRAADLEPYDAFILSDVLAQALSPQTMAAIRTWVEELGGGFIIAGGESVFGEEGYAETAIEEIMPVWFKAEHEPRDLALVIAMDKSYSMVGEKMALAKEASRAALDLMEPEQQFGLLAFDYHFYWPVPIQKATDKARIGERIASIEASSPTNIYPALQDVYQALLGVDAEVKHVILLSDGKTYEDDYETLVTQMHESEITVSTVAVGDKADRELMSNIAEWGAGRTYYLEDPARVPQVFIDETQLAQGITIEEGDDVVPAVKQPIEAFAGLDLEALPPLLGYVRTMAKEHADVILETEEEDPLLVRWQYGLGRTVLFASDVKNRWATEWLGWDGYGKFWTQLVRETMRHRLETEASMWIVRDDHRATIVVDAVDSRGQLRNSLRPVVQVSTAAGGASDIELAQVAPGRYEASLPLAADQAARFVYRQGDGPDIERSVQALRSPEDLVRVADAAGLRRLAEATGGVFEPPAASVGQPDERSVERPLRLWPILAAVALIAYLANLLLRRVRLFDEAGWLEG